MAYVLGKNEEVIGYADRLGRVNGEPGRDKGTRVAERSNMGLTESVWRSRLHGFTRRMQQVPPGEGGEEQDPVSPTLSTLNELIEIQLFARLLCGPERLRKWA
jgi:hypothetical protein